MKNASPAYVVDGTITMLLTDECPVCFALVASDSLPTHLDWHRSVAEQVARMLDRGER